MVLYKTEGSFCLLVHDDIATSSAWHAKGSGSLALEGRLPGLQIMGRKLQSRSNRARKRAPVQKSPQARMKLMLATYQDTVRSGVAPVPTG